jgi:hypothetical protein
MPYWTEILAKAITDRKKNTLERRKRTLELTGKTIINVENTKASIKKLICLISDLRKVGEYKINIQKSTVLFIYGSKQLSNENF